MHLRRLLSCVLVVLVLVLVNGAAPAEARTQVYLLRGIFNVSVGLDALAAKFRRMGVAATVYGHGESGSVASEAIRDYRAHKVGSVGKDWTGAAVVVTLVPSGLTIVVVRDGADGGIGRGTRRILME